MTLLGLVFLVGCTQTEELIETPTVVMNVQQTITSDETVVNPPTSIPQALPTEAVVPELSPTNVAKNGPEPTLIPCEAVLTSANQEGPFYSPGSPQKTSLIEEGMPGVPILIFGRVFDQGCNPIPGAKLDFWLADVNGEYDNVGFTLRGHLFTDENGNYALESIEPTPYTGRPPHIHVKVFAPDGRELLTTQMYFSGSEESSDVTASPDLLADYLGADENGHKRALFNFIVQN
jgi:protocatechuate 3,4-dioxygenase beta subunit